MLYLKLRLLFSPLRLLFSPLRLLFSPLRLLFSPLRLLFSPLRLLFSPLYMSYLYDIFSMMLLTLLAYTFLLYITLKIFFILLNKYNNS